MMPHWRFICSKLLKLLALAFTCLHADCMIANSSTGQQPTSQIAVIDLYGTYVNYIVDYCSLLYKSVSISLSDSRTWTYCMVSSREAKSHIYTVGLYYDSPVVACIQHHVVTRLSLWCTGSEASCHAMLTVRAIQRPTTPSAVLTDSTISRRVTPDAETRKRLSTEPTRERFFFHDEYNIQRASSERKRCRVLRIKKPRCIHTMRISARNGHLI